MPLFTILVLLLALAEPPAPVQFAPGIVSNADSSPTFSRDGSVLLFAQRGNHKDTIVESHLLNGVWSQPIPASFSGTTYDMDPAFSPDGSYVIFASMRPNVEIKKGMIARLWRVNRTTKGWGTPVLLPAAVNDGAFNVAPSVAADGTLYFLHIDTAAHRQIYRARFTGGAYEKSAPLPFSAAAKGDYDPAPAPDQSYVVFASDDRDGPSDSKEHLYIVSFSGVSWGPVQPLRYAGVPGNDGGPALGRDGKTLYFTSDRDGQSNVWTIPIPTAGKG